MGPEKQLKCVWNTSHRSMHNTVPHSSVLPPVFLACVSYPFLSPVISVTCSLFPLPLAALGIFLREPWPTGLGPPTQLPCVSVTSPCEQRRNDISFSPSLPSWSLWTVLSHKYLSWAFLWLLPGWWSLRGLGWECGGGAPQPGLAGERPWRGGYRPGQEPALAAVVLKAVTLPAFPLPGPWERLLLFSRPSSALEHGLILGGLLYISGPSFQQL